ncbi:OsmC family peroxiredoxin [Mucilaginibacter terrenus]|uniref:OsmC family peroxiredoxin n=1 Tax=Mucilaginibacter terrenus TaxID=2482727 RepID=A0A3E2NUE7_9SPHI|nr:OsmC family protein [Mucilaginibacter terrenus]RFZ84636.1 OsmC family peroxiredoxin [Mucilaginibacter terrenus]
MDTGTKDFIINGSAVIGRAQYQTIVNSGHHNIIADEPAEDGGTDTGMSPYQLLLASLASCTAITLRMYINRKRWAINEIKVNLEMYRTNDGILIDSRLYFKGEITEDQRKRLIKIADACPIHKILVGNITINTSLAQD